MPIAIIWYLLYLLRVYLLSLAADAPLDFYQIGWMASLVLFLQMVPITLKGIGLRDSVYAMFFGLEALPSEKGVLIGLLFFSQMFVIPAFGGVVSFFERAWDPTAEWICVVT